MSKQVWLLKDKQEHFNLKRGWLVNAYRIVDVCGVDVIQPWFSTKGEAIAVAKDLWLDLSGTWCGPWQLVQRAGWLNERVVGTYATYDDAYCALHEQYTPEEQDELDIDIMKNGSCEY